MKQIPENFWEQCPMCPNAGGYGIEDYDYEEGTVESMGYPIVSGVEFEHVKCEFWLDKSQ